MKKPKKCFELRNPEKMKNPIRNFNGLNAEMKNSLMMKFYNKRKEMAKNLYFEGTEREIKQIKDY